MRAVSAFALALLLAAGSAAQAASCRDYLPVAARVVKPRVEALRMVEREAADRTKGLDTRPYQYLAGQARAAAEAIGEARALEDEDELAKCPAAVSHVRRVCATAARALALALDEQAAGAPSQISRQIYGQAMPICEGLISLSPLRTPLRADE
jgi:hypothetical protein